MQRLLRRSAALLEMCLSSSKTMRQHIVLMTQSSFCEMRHRSSSVLTSIQPSKLLHLGHAARACMSYIEYQSTIWTTCGSILLRHGLDFSTAWWTMQLISGKKDWKHVSVHEVVTLNTCCDGACPTFQLPHITIGSFQSHQCQPTTGSFQSHQCHQRFQEHNITFSQMKKFCILQGSVVTFFRCGG